MVRREMGRARQRAERVERRARKERRRSEEL